MRREFSKIDSCRGNVPPHPRRCLCRLAARRKTRESNRFQGAPLRGTVARSDEADSWIPRLQQEHGRKLRIHSSGPAKKPHGPCRHGHDRLLHGDDRPQDGYAPRARRASIGTTTQWPPCGTIARFFVSLACECSLAQSCNGINERHYWYGVTRLSVGRQQLEEKSLAQLAQASIHSSYRRDVTRARS